MLSVRAELEYGIHGLESAMVMMIVVDVLGDS